MRNKRQSLASLAEVMAAPATQATPSKQTAPAEQTTPVWHAETAPDAVQAYANTLPRVRRSWSENDRASGAKGHRTGPVDIWAIPATARSMADSPIIDPLLSRDNGAPELDADRRTTKYDLRLRGVRRNAHSECEHRRRHNQSSSTFHVSLQGHEQSDLSLH